MLDVSTNNRDGREREGGGEGRGEGARKNSC